MPQKNISRLLSRSSFLAAALALTVTGCAPASPALNAIDQRDETVTENPPSQENIDANAKRIADLGFVEPKSGVAAESIPPSFASVDPEGVVPKNLLSQALSYYQANSSRIANRNYVTIVDFSSYSGTKRMYVVDMRTGAVWTLHVAHGSGSDRNNDGYADFFSNQNGSNASSLGYYLTAETYSGKHGYSLRIDGLSSTNSNVRARAVVVHGADYVHETDVRAGRSNGCFAVAMTQRTDVVNKIRGGSLIFAGQSR